MASVMLKYVAVDRSQSDSETISLPVQILLAKMKYNNVFDRIRKATITSNVSSVNKRNPGPEPSCSAGWGSPNRRHGSDASCRDSGQSLPSVLSAMATMSGKYIQSASNLLKVLTEQVTAQDLTTDPINKDLAKLVNELMFKEKTDKKLSEQVKTSAEKIKRPENCDGLVCTKVDELIWSRLQSTTESMDSRFKHG
ncbi:hypothetical protein FSP39_006531 [Pinctada imbricata]|uniref:Uncharacterized protein n=1 Tax=Pinctada imbricata TaxID=66713 RepID=A0AA89C6I0_PINIB|nr:hypothetical protein FSP39_006531 [Pinctada imbricata]